MHDLVFLNPRTGLPHKNSRYNTDLYRLCRRAGIPYCNMQILRHTYGLRALGAGVPYRTLLVLLGYNIDPLTSGYFAPVTEADLAQAITRFEAAYDT